MNTTKSFEVKTANETFTVHESIGTIVTLKHRDVCFESEVQLVVASSGRELWVATVDPQFWNNRTPPPFDRRMNVVATLRGNVIAFDKDLADALGKVKKA